MQKLKLDLDSLDVASFETGEAEERRGTVEANSTPAIVAAAIIINAARLAYLAGRAVAG